MANHSTSEGPLQELKHDAEPGYPKMFWITFLAITAYLAFILISSPGKAKKDYDKKAKGYQSEKYEGKKPK